MRSTGGSWSTSRHRGYEGHPSADRGRRGRRRRGPARAAQAGGGAVSIELLASKERLEYRPLAVAEPFGDLEPKSFSLADIARDQGARLRMGVIGEVESADHTVRTAAGEHIAYDVLLVAVGARASSALPGAVTLGGSGRTNPIRNLLRELEEERVSRIAFALPGGVSWPVPLYELALMTAARVSELGLRRVELSLVTPESSPLELFGPEASRAVRALLEGRGVALHTERYPVALRQGQLSVVPRGLDPLEADRVVSLPRLHGPGLPGLPHGPEGFIPVDLHGRVLGEEDVYAAGDVTEFPIKQGGIATQQADAAAEHIAARAGVPIDPRPFEPVLRGMLLTGGPPRYMRAEVGGGHGERWEVSEHALWWPPSKIAGRYLAPYLALHDLEEPSARRGGLRIEVPLEPHAGSGRPPRTTNVP
jgi:sulfide:quinone oxidoreductase